MRQERWVHAVQPLVVANTAMRRIVKTSVLFAVIYFIIGFVIAKSNFFPCFTYQFYIESSTFISGIASIFGLLTLGTPALTTKDLKELELDSLKEVVNLAENMKKADDELLKRSSEIVKRSSEIDQLEQKKKRMELLMQKACMSIHLNDKHKGNTEQLIRIYRENKNIEKRLCALDEDIEQSGDRELIKEIMEIVERKIEHERTNSVEMLNNLFWIKPSFLGIGIDINELFSRMLKITKK